LNLASYSKELFRNTLFLLLIAFIFSSCVEDTSLNSGQTTLQENQIKRTFTSIQKDKFLKTFREESNPSSFGFRIAEDDNQYFDKANWSKAFRHEDLVKGEVTYTIPLITENVETFTNLIVVKKGIDTNSYLIRYLPEKEWIETKQRRHGFGNFSGTIQLLRLDGEVFSESQYLHGVAIQTENTNSRVSGCTTEIVVTGFTTVCVNGDCIISEVRYAEVETCESNPGGDLPPGSGGTGGGSSAGGSTGSGDLGIPGMLDPEDIAYWLRPLNPQDDLNNPYDGMKAVSTDGTIYTYDAQVDAWLMPEVVVMEEQGFIANFFGNPDFDGGVVTAMTLTLTTTAKRSPIGQVIIGTIAFNLWLYSMYEVMTSESSPDQACWDFLLECQRWNYKYSTNFECYKCLGKCKDTKIGKWPYTDCPIGYYE